MTARPPLICVLGPTAAGKSELAARLAQALGTVEQGAGEAAGPGALAPPRPPR